MKESRDKRLKIMDTIGRERQRRVFNYRGTAYATPHSKPWSAVLLREKEYDGKRAACGAFLINRPPNEHSYVENGSSDLLLTAAHCLMDIGYRFIPDIHEAASLYPHNSLAAVDISQLAEMMIVKFNGVLLDSILPEAGAAAKDCWLNRMTATVPLAVAIASPCSTMWFTHINRILTIHTKALDIAACSDINCFVWCNQDRAPYHDLIAWINISPKKNL
uniref:Uncharacterized protein n=1 Tax=Romanomermis culicivorax TaxID=13658 RepID=A0A915K7W2_ROMCU